MGRDGDTRVFLGNLPPDCRVADIEQFFEKFGRVRHVLIKQSKYGFAEFDTPRDAEDAVRELDGTRLLGSRITLEFAKVRSGQPSSFLLIVHCAGSEEGREEGSLGLQVWSSNQNQARSQGGQSEQRHQLARSQGPVEEDRRGLLR